MRNTYRRLVGAILLIALAVLWAAGEMISQRVVWQGREGGVSSIVFSPDA